jgi:hypothetical protein
MANGKRELIEDISDIRRLAGLSEAPKKAAPNPQDIEGKGDLGGIFGNPKGSDYQSKGGQVVDKGGKVNWGDPDSASDFFRADKMQQAQQAQQATPTPKAAAPKPVAPKAPGQSVDDIKAFQRANGLTPDGIVGPKTREAQAKANSTPSYSPPIQPRNTDVRPDAGSAEKAMGSNLDTPPMAVSPSTRQDFPTPNPGIDTVPQSKYRIPGSDIANPGVQKPTQSITNQPPVIPNPSSPKIDPKILSPNYVEPGFGPNDAEQFKPVPPAPRPKPFVEPKIFTPPDKKPAVPNAPYSPGGGAVDDKRTFLQRNLPNALGGLDAPPQINPSAPKLDTPPNLGRGTIAPAPMPVIRTPTPNVDNMPVQQFKGPNVDPGMDATNKLPKIEPFKGDMGDSFTGSAGPTPKAAAPAPKPQALNTAGAGTSQDFADKDPSTMKDIVKELRQMAGIPEDGIPGQGMAQEAMAQFESKGKKPDFLDVDKDGDEEEPMTKALDDKEEEKVEEGIEVNPINDSLSLIKRLAGLK